MDPSPPPPPINLREDGGGGIISDAGFGNLSDVPASTEDVVGHIYCGNETSGQCEGKGDTGGPSGKIFPATPFFQG